MNSSWNPQAHQLPKIALSPLPHSIPGPVWLGYLWRAATRRPMGGAPASVKRTAWRPNSAQVEDIEKITRDMTLHYIKDTTSKGCPWQVGDVWISTMNEGCMFFGPGHFFFGPEWCICTHTFGNRGKLCTVKSVKNSCSMQANFL